MHVELLMLMELLIYIEIFNFTCYTTQRQGQEQEQHNHRLFHIIIYLGYEVGEVRDHVEEARGSISPDKVRENGNQNS